MLMMGARAGMMWLIFASLASCSTRTTNLAGGASGRDAAPADAALHSDGRVPATDGQVPSDAAGPPLTLGDAGVLMCGDHVCACSDGKDNDGDGKIDGFDPECTGPFDDDERTFGTGVPGEDRNAHCLDCAFDGNAGSGDDQCRYPASCLDDGTASGGGSCNSCTPSKACVDNCLDRTPNGCDCFGCCEIQRPTGSVFIQLRDTCSIDTVDDASKCPRCVRSKECVNVCDPCELCPGRDASMLPASCTTGPNVPVYQCTGGKLCGNGLPCDTMEYCELGCCIPIVI
jgi:hypothetical protein